MRNASRPLSFAMRKNSTDHLVGERSEVAPSDSLCAGIKRIFPFGMLVRVEKLPWTLMVVEFHGVSS